MPLPIIPIAAGVGFVWGLWKLFTWGGGGGGGGGGDVEPPAPVVTYDELGTTYEDGYKAGQADGLAANITFAWETSPDWESGKVHYHADKPEAWKKGYNAGYYAAISKSSGGGGDIVKTSPDNPEGTVADYNEFYNKGRNVVDQAISDEAKASESGETYCEAPGACVGNINHLVAARKSIKTNQGRLGFDAGVHARATELGLSMTEDGDLY